MKNEARDLSFAELSEGREHQEEYVITPAVYDAFLAAFDDRSPIHVDAEAAKAAGFRGRVMFGALLNGFLSHFVGMRFPGRRALLLSSDLRYLNPSYAGDKISLHARVDQAVEAQGVVVLLVDFKNLTQGTQAAKGRVQVKVRRE